MKRTLHSAAALAVTLAALASPTSAMVRGKPVSGISLYDEPKYGPDFKNFDYVNPNAPKGGTLVMGNQNDQTFDTFNPLHPQRHTRPARGADARHPDGGEPR